MVVVGVPEIVIPDALSKLKTKYSECCSSKMSSIIGIFTVNVAGDYSVMKIVCDANVKSALSAVLNGADFTTKSTKLVAGFAIFNTKDNVPWFSFTVMKLDAKEILGFAVVKIPNCVVVIPLSFKSSTVFGNKDM